MCHLRNDRRQMIDMKGNADKRRTSKRTGTMRGQCVGVGLDFGHMPIALYDMICFIPISLSLSFTHTRVNTRKWTQIYREKQMLCILPFKEVLTNAYRHSSFVRHRRRWCSAEHSRHVHEQWRFWIYQDSRLGLVGSVQRNE